MFSLLVKEIKELVPLFIILIVNHSILLVSVCITCSGKEMSMWDTAWQLAKQMQYEANCFFSLFFSDG